MYINYVANKKVTLDYLSKVYPIRFYLFRKRVLEC